MPNFRFILSYLALFAMCMFPMALFGDGTISILLCVMMNSSFALSAGPISLGVGFVLSFVGVSILTGSATAGIFFALTAVLPPLCAWLIYTRKWSFSEKMCAISTVFVVTFSLWEMNFIRLSGISIHQTVQEIANNQEVLSLLGTEDGDTYRKVMEMLIPYVEGIVPGLFLIVAIIGSYLILSGMSRMVRFRYPQMTKSIPEFRMLELPRPLMVLGIAAFAGAALVISQPAVILCLNVVMVIGFLAAVCGLSLIDFYFSRIVKSSFFRMVIYIFVMNLTMFLPLSALAIVGMVDSFGRFRRRKTGDKGE